MSSASDLADRPHTVYRAYSADGTLLYVGMSSDVRTRLERHRRFAPWWGVCARFTYEAFPNRDKGLAAERAAIRAERPLHNVRVNMTEEEIVDRIRRGRARRPPRTYRDIASSLGITREEVIRLAGVPAGSLAARWSGRGNVPAEPTAADYARGRRR